MNRYDCSLAKESAKRRRLGELCYFFGEAVKTNMSMLKDWSKSMFDTDLLDCQSEEGVKQAVFQYCESRGKACISSEISYAGEKADAKVWFPLWMLKKAAKDGISYVSWRLVEVEFERMKKGRFKPPFFHSFKETISISESGFIYICAIRRPSMKGLPPFSLSS